MGILLIVALTLVAIFVVVKALIAEVTVLPRALMVLIGMFPAQMVLKSKSIGIVALKCQETRVVTYTCRCLL